jgi:hypothetical protein
MVKPFLASVSPRDLAPVQRFLRPHVASWQGPFVLGGAQHAVFETTCRGDPWILNARCRYLGAIRITQLVSAIAASA